MIDTPIWAIMPALNNPELTEAAISDLLVQSVPTRILLILQGADRLVVQRFQQIAEQEPRLLVWSHDPALPSLSATWNRALDFVWAVGGTEALVVNNDVRLSPLTVGMLKMNMERSNALFITAVGVAGDQFDKWRREGDEIFSVETTSGVPANSKGGPDFSCFLISKTCHEKYQFDELIIPLFSEDLDFHRRMMLGGDGDKIFSINLPYLHIGGGSQTLKSMTPEARAKKERQIGGARAYYASAWGGQVNQERYTIKYDPSTAQDGVTTPELQAACLAGETTRRSDQAVAPAQPVSFDDLPHA